MSAAPVPRARLRRSLLGLGLVVLAGWLAFFDSHSLLKRFNWHREHARLVAENTVLAEEIEALQRQLDEGVPDAVIERIAREEYGMRRPGETVYRVEED